MDAKVQERIRAVTLRRQGKSYREIQQTVKVSKGTLSKWFSNLPLTKKEERFLVERSRILQDNGRLKVALKNKEENESRRERVRVRARIDFRRYKDDPFFTLGLALYWAEGAKTGNYFSFATSDEAMLKNMLLWAERFLPVEPSDFRYRLHLHKPYANDRCERYWSRQCAIPLSQFKQTVLVPVPKKFTKNPLYKGSLRLIIPGINQLIMLQTWQKELSLYHVGAS